MPGEDQRIDSLDSGELTVDGVLVRTVDEVIESFPTNELDTSKVLAPDGVGGVTFVPGGGGGGGYPSLTAVTVSSFPYNVPATGVDVVLCDASGGGGDVNLPSPVNGKQITVKKIAGNNAASRRIYVTGTGGADIDGDSDQMLRNQYETITVVSDGTDWWVI